MNGTLFFAADDGGGYEIWKSERPNYDAASTSKIDINPTPSTGSDPGPLVNANGTLLFNADGGSGEELFKIAPPYTTAVQVKDINASGGSDIDYLTNLNGTVLQRE